MVGGGKMGHRDLGKVLFKPGKWDDGRNRYVTRISVENAEGYKEETSL